MYMFDENKNKVDVKYVEGTLSVAAGEVGTKTISFSVIGDSIDFRNYMVIGVMSGYGSSIGGTNYQGNPKTAFKVVNNEVYPNAEFDMNTDYSTLKVNLYNESDSRETIWYRVILMRVSNEF